MAVAAGHACDGDVLPPWEFPADYTEFYDKDNGEPGIPGFKIAGNDGHVVTAREIRAALATYDALLGAETTVEQVVDLGRPPVRFPVAVVKVFTDQHEHCAWMFEAWEAWIAFLRRAAQARGITVT